MFDFEFRNSWTEGLALVLALAAGFVILGAVSFAFSAVGETRRIQLEAARLAEDRPGLDLRISGDGLEPWKVRAVERATLFGVPVEVESEVLFEGRRAVSATHFLRAYNRRSR